ncbi:hypothetical protein AB0R12_40105, partial [Streptomyces niveus]
MTGIRPTAVRTGAAHRLLPLAERILGARLPLRLRAWDGSVAGPEDAPVVVLRSRRALRRLIWQPDELGLAQAYITGDLDIDGDLADGLRTVWGAARERGLRGEGQHRPAPEGQFERAPEVVVVRPGDGVVA